MRSRLKFSAQRIGAMSGMLPPINLVPPVVTGTRQQGQTLTCSTGTWTGSPTSFNYLWTRRGAQLQNGPSNTYVPLGTDVGYALTCVVTATNAAGSTTASAGSTGTIVAAYPTITGSQATSHNATIALPSNSTGDTLLIYTVGTASYAITGFTKIASIVFDSGNGPYTAGLYSKLSSGGESTATAAGSSLDALALVVGGTHTIDAFATAENDTPGTSIQAPSVTLTGALDVLLNLYVTEDTTITVPAGQTKISGPASPYLFPFCVGWENLSAAGATGTRTATSGSSAIWAAISAGVT